MNDTYRSQFRLPFDLADKLRDAAEASGRSLNAEVVSRLEASFASTAFPARDAEELHAMLDIAKAQQDFHVALSELAEARDLFSRTRMRYDALVIQENAVRHADPDASFLRDMAADRMKALEETENAHRVVAMKEEKFHATQAALSSWHIKRVMDRKT